MWNGRITSVATHESYVRREGNDDIRPDLFSYNSVLYAIAKEKTSGTGGANTTSSRGGGGAVNVQRAESLLKRMEDGVEGDTIRPDVVSYNAVLTAYAESRELDAERKTRDMLHRMAERGVDPDLRDYTICINVLGKSSRKGRRWKLRSCWRCWRKGIGMERNV